METPSKRKKISRIDLRHRRSAVEVEPKEESAPLGEEEEWPVGIIDEPLLVRERQGRKIMGNKHLMFHRRQAESTPPVLTVVVDVIATVDLNGNVIGTETKAPTTDAIATIAALPTVPAVPPFPSDLKVPPVPSVPAVSMPTVPAFPFPSGVPSIQPLDSVDPSTATATPARTGTQASLSFASGSFNSTSTSTGSSTSTSSDSRSDSRSSTLTASSSSPSESTSTPFSSSSISSLSDSSSIVSSNWPYDGAASSTTAYIVGGGPVNTAAPPAATTPAVNASVSENSPPISTPKVVGSVIGSLAGAAVLLALLLLLIRRYRRKRGGALPLPGQDAGDSQPIAASGQDMAQRRSLPASAPFFSRFSVTSRSTADTSTTGERGFQRVSGRKLPSAFSEGMTSEQFEPREGTLSGSSFYRDETGFYGGPGSSSQAPGSAGAVGTKEKIMPSPARTPVIHHPDDVPPFGTPKGSNFSPPQSPPTGTPRPRGTLGRSHPSFDGSRGSKFTEDV